METNVLSCHGNEACPEDTICDIPGTKQCHACSTCQVLPFHGCEERCGAYLASTKSPSSSAPVAPSDHPVPMVTDGASQQQYTNVVFTVITLFIGIAIGIVIVALVVVIRKKALIHSTACSESLCCYICNECGICPKGGQYDGLQRGDSGGTSVGDTTAKVKLLTPEDSVYNRQKSTHSNSSRDSAYESNETADYKGCGLRVSLIGETPVQKEEGFCTLFSRGTNTQDIQPECDIVTSVNDDIKEIETEQKNACEMPLISGGRNIGHNGLKGSRESSGQSPSAVTMKRNQSDERCNMGTRIQNSGNDRGTHPHLNVLREKGRDKRTDKKASQGNPTELISGDQKYAPVSVVTKDAEHRSSSSSTNKHGNQSNTGSTNRAGNQSSGIPGDNMQVKVREKTGGRNLPVNSTKCGKGDGKMLESGGNIKGTTVGDDGKYGSKQAQGVDKTTKRSPRGNERGTGNGGKPSDTTAERSRKSSGRTVVTVSKAAVRSCKPSKPSDSTRMPTEEAEDGNRLQLDLFSNVFIDKDPRTEIRATHRVEPAVAPTPASNTERENALIGSDEKNDAPPLIECAGDKEKQEGRSADPPSVEVVDGGQSHRGSAELWSSLNYSGFGSVGGAVGGTKKLSMTPSEEFRMMTKKHMEERGVGTAADNQLGNENMYEGGPSSETRVKLEYEEPPAQVVKISGVQPGHQRSILYSDKTPSSGRDTTMSQGSRFYTTNSDVV